MEYKANGHAHGHDESGVIVLDKRVIFNTVISGLLLTSILSVIAVRDTVAELEKENEARMAEVSSTASAIRELKTKQEEMLQAQTILAQEVRVSGANQQHFSNSLQEIKASIDSIQRLLQGRAP